MNEEKEEIVTSGSSSENEEESENTDDEDDDRGLDQSDESGAGANRKKRSIEWCGVSTETRHFSPSSSYDINWGNLDHGLNPSSLEETTNKMQLISRTQFYLAVYPDGKVRGTQDKNDLHTHLELINAGSVAHLRIRARLTNLYVAINHKGRFYADPVDGDNTVFVEGLKGLYMTYLSLHYAHKGWYLGINKGGRIKNGKKTALKQKAIQFLKQRKHFQ